jgi:hypothetical protein
MWIVRERQNSWSVAWLFGFVVCLGALAAAGCERKERVVDVEGPGIDIEVDRNVDTGEVEVNAQEK